MGDAHRPQPGARAGSSPAVPLHLYAQGTRKRHASAKRYAAREDVKSSPSRGMPLPLAGLGVQSLVDLALTARPSERLSAEAISAKIIRIIRCYPANRAIEIILYLLQPIINHKMQATGNSNRQVSLRSHQWG